MKKLILIGFIVALVLGIGVFFRMRERIFPEKYRFLVALTSRKYNIDPIWIASIIFIESSFNPEAVSSSGACGLMQLMPETAREIARKTGKVLENKKDIFLPSLNIELGCWYLSHLEDIFNDNTLAIIAYNAGRGNLQKWIDSNPQKDSIEIIEFPETKEYVKKVQRTYRFLRFLHKIWAFY